MMAVALAMLVGGLGAAGLIWPSGPEAVMVCAPVCAVLAAVVVTPSANKN